MVSRTVKYNRQTDNKDFPALRPWQQCFSTSAWMLLGYLCPELYDGSDDAGLAKLVEDVSNHVGAAGIGETIMAQQKLDPHNESAYIWIVWKMVLKKYLTDGGKNGTVVYMDGNCSLENLYKALDVCPVIVGTYKMGGLPGGHIILVTGYTDECSFICHDPFGNANSGYKDKNGENVVYSKDYLTTYIGTNTIRALWYY